MDPHSALRYAHEQERAFVSELKEFLRFQTVSSGSKFAAQLKACSRWLARHLRDVGMQRVAIIRTPGNPIVFASWGNDPAKPTVLIYGHYDVLPGEPLERWKTAPFQPRVIGNRLYARGASDDKGQLFTHIKAIESYLKTGLELPVNVKCVFEGEEEIGSPHLDNFIRRNRRALKSDVALISDTSMPEPDQPAISYAERGELRAELSVRGPIQELHSGNYGGAIRNPLEALCSIIASLHQDDGKVAIPGFYDDVRRWGARERAYMARTGPDDAKIIKDAGVRHGWGEAGYSAYERTTIRPAVVVNSVFSGDRGPGAKSIIPAEATAKLGFRLVPDQDPERIARLFREFVEEVTPREVSSKVRTFAGIKPALIDRDHPAVQAAADAYKRGFGRFPVFLRSGGSIPVVNSFQDILGIPTVLMGFGLPADRIHAPNESFLLPNFYRAISTSIWFLSFACNLRGVERGRSRSGACASGAQII